MTEDALDRRKRTIILLETRTSWFPQPKSQFSTFGALPGEKATKRKPCGRCSQEGTIGTRSGSAVCPDCQGKGFYLVDSYTGRRDTESKQFTATSAVDRKERRQASDRELARLELQLATPSEVSSLSLQDEKPELWERERDRHFRAGDYRALDLALDWLGDQAPAARRLAEWTFEFKVIPLGAATASLTKLAYLSVDLVNTQMPDPIRVPHWHLNGEAHDGYKARHAA